MTALRVELEVAAPLRDVAEPLSAQVGRRATERMIELGIRRDVETEVRVRDGVSLVRVVLDGRPLRHATSHRTRARMSALRRLLRADEVDRAGAPIAAPSPEHAVEELSALVDALLIRRPEVLLDGAASAEIAEELGAPPGETTRVALHALLSHGFSLGDRERIALALGHGGDDPEDVVAVLPRSLAIQTPRADLWRLLREDAAGDLRPFSAVHAGATVPLPDIALEPNDAIPPGCARIRVNDLVHAAQPILPTGCALSLSTHAGDAVHVVAWRRNAHLVEDTTPSVSTWTSWEYLAAEVHDTLRSEARRLIDRSTVERWCDELRLPALLAAFTEVGGRTVLPRILRRLASEQVPVPDLTRVLQRIVDHRVVESPPPRSHFVLTSALPIDAAALLPAPEDRVYEHVRGALGSIIFSELAVGEDPLPILLLSPEIEEHLISGASADWIQQLVDAVVDAAHAHPDAAVIVSIENRSTLRRLVEDALPHRAVLSFQELPMTANLTLAARITVPVESNPTAEPRAAAGAEAALLLADRDGVPVGEAPISIASLAAFTSGRVLEPFRRRDEWARDDFERPDDLAAQGWGLIVPATDRGRAIQEAIEELVSYRVQHQGVSPWIRRVAPGMDYAAADEWVRRTYEAELEHNRPRYLLILGDFPEVSLELQQVLAPLACVGRLAFDDLEDYRRYARKVVAVEKQRHSALATLGFCASDFSPATLLGRSHLFEPLMEELETLTRTPGACLADPRTIEGGKRELLAGVQETGLLLTVSHGVGSEMPYEERRTTQGALVLGRRDCLTGNDVATGRFLPGGVWFMFACYGAGTPARSVYGSWIETLAGIDGPWKQHFLAVRSGMLTNGEAPFVAELPRRALANPDGPIAVIGHVDLAWSYSFTDRGQGRHSRILPALRVLLRQQLAGFAHEQLMRPCASATARLADLYRQADAHDRGQGPPVDREELLRAWILREDLRGFIVLGDPAARMRLPPKSRGDGA